MVDKKNYKEMKEKSRELIEKLKQSNLDNEEIDFIHFTIKFDFVIDFIEENELEYALLGYLKEKLEDTSN